MFAYSSVMTKTYSLSKVALVSNICRRQTKVRIKRLAKEVKKVKICAKTAKNRELKNVQIFSNTENDNNAYADTCKYSRVLIFPI